eukprot:11647412-Alexandrium_andersonii.AAC.1
MSASLVGSEMCIRDSPPPRDGCTVLCNSATTCSVTRNNPTFTLWQAANPPSLVWASRKGMHGPWAIGRVVCARALLLFQQPSWRVCVGIQVPILSR